MERYNVYVDFTGVERKKTSGTKMWPSLSGQEVKELITNWDLYILPYREDDKEEITIKIKPVK